MKKYMAFDIGGYSVKYAVLDEAAKILEKGDFRTPKSLFELLDSISNVTKKYENSYGFEGIAISSPGAVDNKLGIIKGSSAVPYIHGPNIRELIEEKTGYKVGIENDANCAALSEVWKGAAKDYNDIAFIVCGTGIGGAIIKNRKLHLGKNLHGGEFGYFIMEKDFKKGEFLNWSEVGSINATTKYVATKKNIDIEEINGKKVFELAEEGDKDSIEAVERYYETMAIGIFNLQYFYDPEVIVLGGAVTQRVDLLNRINEKLDILMDNISIAKIRPIIKKCEFLNDSNLVGAVYNFINTFDGM